MYSCRRMFHRSILRLSRDWFVSARSEKRDRLQINSSSPTPPPPTHTLTQRQADTKNTGGFAIPMGDIASSKNRPQKHTRAWMPMHAQTRSARDKKVWELCLTPTALEGTGGGNTNKALLLRLADVIGAKATPVEDGTGGRGDGNEHESFVHRLEVFAYVPGGDATETGTGCAASSG